MKDIINWLIRVEEMSANLYLAASELFREDQPLCRYLQHSAEDEAWHFHIMQSAAESLKDIEKDSSIILDRETMDRIENTFKNCIIQLEKGELHRETLINCIVRTEFSEWNPLFLYVIDVLKKDRPAFRYGIPKIQHHLRHTQHFLENDPHGRQLLKQFRSLEPVWEEKILVVDDEEAICNLLEAVLETEGAVETAENGQKGLEKLSDGYFKLVISDMDMPVMNGFDFYHKAVEKFSNIRDRFLFFSGNFTQQHIRYFNEKGIRYMEKPAPLAKIRANALEIMHLIKDEAVD